MTEITITADSLAQVDRVIGTAGKAVVTVASSAVFGLPYTPETTTSLRVEDYALALGSLILGMGMSGSLVKWTRLGSKHLFTCISIALISGIGDIACSAAHIGLMNGANRPASQVPIADVAKQFFRGLAAGYLLFHASGALGKGAIGKLVHHNELFRAFVMQAACLCMITGLFIWTIPSTVISVGWGFKHLFPHAEQDLKAITSDKANQIKAAEWVGELLLSPITYNWNRVCEALGLN